MPQLAPGAQIAGYRIESLVGRGGMGVVYRAVQLGLERRVALKVIAPELLDDDEVRARFLAEARAAASVDHANVIPVHEAGEADGLAYIAMRFVNGSDLRSLVRAGGALDVGEAVRVVAQAAAGLDAIHRAGFVHRDVKPANLLLDNDGHVYVTDFGLAKEMISRTGATRTGHWVGTLDYVAPEQIRGATVDARADVYALGGVLHYALTARVPFEAQGEGAKLWAQLSAPPPVPSQVRPGLRPELDAVVARAMAKAPEERYPSAGDLARAALAAATGTRLTEPERMVARGPAAAPGEEAATRTSARLRRRRRWWLAAAVVPVVVAAVIALREQPEPERATRPTPTASPAPFATQTIERIGDRPNGLVLAGDELWVSSSNSEWLTIVSARTGRERADHVRIGPDIRGLAAYRGSVWVAKGDTNELLRIDAGKHRIADKISVPGQPARLAVDRRGVWVGTSEPADARLLRFDPRTGALEQQIGVREGIGGLAAGAGSIWVIKASTHKLARLRPGRDGLTDWASLSGAAETMRYGAGALWITLPGEDALTKVVARNGDVITAAAGRAPGQAVVAGDRVYVTSRNDHSVVVLDPDTLREAAAPIGVGLNPYAIAAAERDVWVTGLADDTLTRIRPQ